MTNMTNTQIRAKSSVEATTADVESEEVSRFGGFGKVFLLIIISGADVSIGALLLSYNPGIGSKNGSHPPKSEQQKYPLASSGHSPVTPGRRPKATAFDSLSHVSSVAHSFR